MYDFFVSGRWRNRDNVQTLVNKIREKGHSVYSFLESTESRENAAKLIPELSVTDLQKSCNDNTTICSN